MSVCRVVLFAVSLLLVAPVQAHEIKRGTAFPLSDGAAPVLISVEVMRITADNTVDLAVSLNPPATLPTTQNAFLLQVAEFCLRYHVAITEMAVLEQERRRIHTFAPLYRIAVSGKANQFREVGFAFRIVEGECVMVDPFPAGLRSEAQSRAILPLGSN
jgi:hypothetical protein